MDGQLAAWGALITALAGAAASIWISLKKRKFEEKKEDRQADAADRAALSETDRKDREIVVKQWKDYVASLTKAHESSFREAEERHRADMAKLEKKNESQDREIAELFEKERNCQIQFTSAQARIEYMTEQLNELRKRIEGRNQRKSDGEIEAT